jgi:cellulose synthase/poly-beta-1,6-N-acetylglucosamine synthase-like glycosyltransferase
MSPLIALFLLCSGLLVYLYLGYPVVIRLLALLRPRGYRRSEDRPAVSVLLVAQNEASRIAARIENLLALDYPRDRIEILVASDGSDDATVEVARSFRRSRVRVVAYPMRRGKPAVLNDLAALATGEILVFADARQRFDQGAVRALVAPFGDPEVGAVSGELIFVQDVDAPAVNGGVGFYWQYEKMIRRSESLFASCVGTTGAIYAVRRELFERIPSGTLLDDVLIPMRIARRGYRVLFEPAARAFDRAAASAGDEFLRKVRTIAGNFQLLARERWIWSPRANPLWLQTFSHKGLRLASPLLMLGAFATNVALAISGGVVFEALLAAQAGFYSAAALGGALRDARSGFRLLVVPYVVCLLNCATVVAFFRYVTGRQRVTWARVPARGTAAALPASPASGKRTA